jgi:multidrug efflux pump subunit AcrB
MIQGYAEPKQSKIFWQGRKFISLAVNIEADSNIIKLSWKLNHVLDKIRPRLPTEMDIYQIFDQPKVIGKAITILISSLYDAVLIILYV